MKQATVEKILEQTKNNYQKLALTWDQTRQQPWPEMNHFLSYIKSGDKVLDMGCGNGRLVKLFADVNIDYLGIDNSSEQIKMAVANHPDYKFQVGNIFKLPFADNYFSAIFCLSVLHHLPSKKLRQQAVAELNRVLKPGGVIFFTNWHWHSKKLSPLLTEFTLAKIKAKSELDFGDIYIGWSDSDIRRYVHLFTKNSIKKLLSAVGFKLIENYISEPTPRGFRNIVSVAKKC